MATELVTNNFAVRLTVGCAAGDSTIQVDSAAPLALQGGQFRVVVDREYMIVTGGQAGTVWTVTRGAEVSTAVSHGVGSWVTHTFTAGGMAGLAANVGAIPGPPGATGLQGAPGVGANWRGVWNSGTTYALGDGVYGSDGQPYISNVGSNLNNNPVGDSGAHWGLASPGGSATTGYLSLRADFSLNPSMSATALHTAINSAIVSAISAGKGIDLGADQWPIDGGPLTIGGNLALRSVGAAEVWSTVGHSINTVVPGAAPWYEGGGIIQQAAGADILDITGTGATVHLRDLVLAFGGSSIFTNTGNAVNGVPTAMSGLGHENGPAGCRWDNIVVFGHDGTHYAFYTVNMNLFNGSQLRGYGGGGWYEEVDSTVSAYGNGTLVQPYFLVMINGTADGFHMKSASPTFPGDLNLVTMVRPQANMQDVTGFPIGTAFSISTPPSSVNQSPYRDVGTPQQMLLIAPDMEPPSYPVVFGTGTQVLGPELSSREGHGNLSYGPGALPGNTQGGANNTAFGDSALNVADSIAQHNTGLGAAALKLATGSANTAVGSQALVANTTGTNNTAVGHTAGTAITTGTFNTAIGDGALAHVTTGGSNTAVGSGALATATGSQQVAVGNNALAAATTSSNNVAVGYGAGASITTASSNTAVGWAALNSTVTGDQNTAVGAGALQANTGAGNVAIGLNALNVSTSGNSNTAVGTVALTANTTGQNNAAVGNAALFANTTGSQNTAIGDQAGRGFVTGSNNTALGYQAGFTDGTNNTTDNSSMTLIGESAQATTGNVIVLGKAIATRPNLIFGGIGAAAAFGSGVGVFALANAATDPTTNPTGGGILFASGGALKWRGSSGTVTTVAAA